MHLFLQNVLLLTRGQALLPLVHLEHIFFLQLALFDSQHLLVSLLLLEAFDDLFGTLEFLLDLLSQVLLFIYFFLSQLSHLALNGLVLCLEIEPSLVLFFVNTTKCFFFLLLVLQSLLVIILCILIFLQNNFAEFLLLSLIMVLSLANLTRYFKSASLSTIVYSVKKFTPSLFNLFQLTLLLTHKAFSDSCTLFLLMPHIGISLFFLFQSEVVKSLFLLLIIVFKLSTFVFKVMLVVFLSRNTQLLSGLIFLGELLHLVFSHLFFISLVLLGLFKPFIYLLF